MQAEVEIKMEIKTMMINVYLTHVGHYHNYGLKPSSTLARCNT